MKQQTSSTKYLPYLVSLTAESSAARHPYSANLVSRGENTPYRMHIRSPSFVNLQALAPMAKGRLFSDMTAIIGALDFVMGEVDR